MLNQKKNSIVFEQMKCRLAKKHRLNGKHDKNKNLTSGRNDEDERWRRIQNTWNVKSNRWSLCVQSAFVDCSKNTT